MPSTPLTLRCLIISPSDVTDARDEIERVIDQFNAQVGPALNVRVEPVRWESHSRPELGGRPQDILNRQIVDECDFGVAAFWARLGTPTGAHDSGSIEEIERLLARGASVLVYFSSAPVPQAALADDQFSRLQEARARLSARGLVWSYGTPEDLGRTLFPHLTRFVAELVTSAGMSTVHHPPAPSSAANRPDVRVAVTRASVLGPGEPALDVVSIKVANHSPRDFFLSSVSVLREDGMGLWPKTDAATGEFNAPKKIEPGNSYTFNVSPAKLHASADGRRLTHAVATDKIGREFRSADGELERELQRKPAEGAPSAPSAPSTAPAGSTAIDWGNLHTVLHPELVTPTIYCGSKRFTAGVRLRTQQRLPPGVVVKWATPVIELDGKRTSPRAHEELPRNRPLEPVGPTDLGPLSVEAPDTYRFGETTEVWVGGLLRGEIAIPGKGDVAFEIGFDAQLCRLSR